MAGILPGDGFGGHTTCKNVPMAEERRWFDRSQPQTLQGAVMLSYLTAAFGVIGLIIRFYPLDDIVMMGLGVGGFGVANEKRWGYRLGVALAGLNVLLDLVVLVRGFIGIFLNLLFGVVLLALYLHAQSREYERIWFH
jgi:energy-converting hydrogenase Eha subunit C